MAEIKNNRRYRDLVVGQDVYIPDVGMDYPEEDPMTKMLEEQPTRDVRIDQDYPYYSNSLSFKIQHFAAYFLVYVPLMLKNVFVYGLRIEGRGVVRCNRKQFKNGVMAVCNHCYRYDGAALALALRWHWLWIPMLKDHFMGKDYWYLRYFGGIPVPEDASALKKFNMAFDEIHERKGWFLYFPEGRNWMYYKPLKPFHKGAFTMAYRYDIPVLPMAITYRERRGLYRLFAPQSVPLMTVRIADPIFPDTSKSRKEEVIRLLEESHAAVCRLAGIVRNTWPAEAAK